MVHRERRVQLPLHDRLRDAEPARPVGLVCSGQVNGAYDTPGSGMLGGSVSDVPADENAPVLHLGQLTTWGHTCTHWPRAAARETPLRPLPPPPSPRPRGSSPNPPSAPAAAAICSPTPPFPVRRTVSVNMTCPASCGVSSREMAATLAGCRDSCSRCRPPIVLCARQNRLGETKHGSPTPPPPRPMRSAHDLVEAETVPRGAGAAEQLDFERLRDIAAE